MIVAGGCYREVCLRPYWDRILGSGLRAAAAISTWGQKVHLVSYASSEWIADAEETSYNYGVEASFASVDDSITFTYLYPLASPTISARHKHAPLHADAATVLRYGFLEGDVVVSAKRGIYDPQGRGANEPFHRNGSTAEHLALVLNENEVRVMGEHPDISSAATKLLADAEVVVVKRGAFGAIVFSRNEPPKSVPPFRSETVFKLGSGDIFTAAFAHCWGERKMKADRAADVASKAVSHYVEQPVLPLCPITDLHTRQPCNTIFQGRVYLAGPFFTTAQVWLMDELRTQLVSFGAEVFSPFHDVGVGGVPAHIAQDDLDGLKSCGLVVAVIDGHDAGTIFEIGYARQLGVPVIVLAENVQEQDLTMLIGTGCRVVPDVTTAIYHALWTEE